MQLKIFFALLYIYGVHFFISPLFGGSLDSLLLLPQFYQNSTTNSFIQTVQLKRTDLEFTAPIILLSSNDILELSFDDLRGGVHYYNYTITHCNQNWQKSDLSYFDFMDGYEQNDITNTAFSFATVQQYTHYNLQFPNEAIQFKQSGNFVIQIWEQDNDTLPVLTRRFYVWENLASITGQVMRPNLTAYRDHFQEINFTVDVGSIAMSNAFENMKVTLKQNNRDDNSYNDLKPQVITNAILQYNDDQIVFEAGKEYRKFDTKNLGIQTDRIKKTEKQRYRIDTYITTDESRSFKQYFYEKDINGNFIIRADLTTNSATEADYSYVHFTFNYPYYLSQGDFYVMGAFNNYSPTLGHKMTYNFEQQTYNVSILLKQGYYNYTYLFIDHKNKKNDCSYAEGNNYQTENEYTVFVYQHEPEQNFDRLIGYKLFKSIK